MFQETLNTIQKYDTIIIHRHTRPDGDALGSQIGLKHLIRENFPEKTVYTVGDGAGYLSFMEGSVMDTIPDSTYENALAILLDSSSPLLISDERWKTASATARFAAVSAALEDFLLAVLPLLEDLAPVAGILLEVRLVSAILTPYVVR